MIQPPLWMSILTPTRPFTNQICKVTYTYALPIESNQVTNSSELCSPSWDDRYTHDGLHQRRQQKRFGKMENRFWLWLCSYSYRLVQANLRTNLRVGTFCRFWELHPEKGTRVLWVPVFIQLQAGSSWTPFKSKESEVFRMFLGNTSRNIAHVFCQPLSTRLRTFFFSVFFPYFSPDVWPFICFGVFGP